jgi:hypothetical protein
MQRQRALIAGDAAADDDDDDNDNDSDGNLESIQTGGSSFVSAHNHAQKTCRRSGLMREEMKDRIAAASNLLLIESKYNFRLATGIFIHDLDTQINQ